MDLDPDTLAGCGVILSWTTKPRLVTLAMSQLLVIIPNPTAVSLAAWKEERGKRNMPSIKSTTEP